MSEPTLLPISQVAEDTIAKLEQAEKDRENNRPIRTGWEDFDSAFGGFPVIKPIYMAIGGKQKSAKTTLGQNFAQIIAASKDWRVGYFQLEEGSEAMSIRSMTSLTVSVGRTDIFNLDLTEESFIELRTAAEKLRRADYLITDRVTKIEDVVKIAVEEKLRWVIVDYYQLLMGGNGKERIERLESISRIILEARNRYGISFIVIYQLNEQGQAFGSRAIYRDADVAMEITETVDSIKDTGILGTISIKFLRNRLWGGRLKDTCMLSFDGDHSRVGNLITFDSL